MVPRERIELSIIAYQATVIPFNYPGKFGGGRGNRILLDSILARDTRSPLLPPNCIGSPGTDRTYDIFINSEAQLPLCY